MLTSLPFERSTVLERAAGVSALLAVTACGLELNGLGPNVPDSGPATTREDTAAGPADANRSSSKTGSGDDAGSDTADATQLSEDATAEEASNMGADGSARDAPRTDGETRPSDGAGDVAPGGPPTIVLGAAAPTAKRGGVGGQPFVDACPGSQMIIGYLGTDGPAQFVDSIQVVCGMVRVTGSGTYQIVVSPGTTLPSRGMTGVSAFAAMCPNNQVVGGIYGHSGLYLDQVGFQCAPLTISQNGTPAVATGAITQLPASGGPGGAAFGDRCPSGQVAVGSDIAAGSFVDSIDLLCATPTLVWPDM